MGNGTRHSEWSTCVGCAMLTRSLEHARKPANYDPELVLAEVSVTNKASLIAVSLGWWYAAVLVAIMTL
ncbi:unnamed protein product [Penicillium bialowiezense]